jgi:integrase
MISFFNRFDPGPTLRQFYRSSVASAANTRTTNAVHKNSLDKWEELTPNPGIKLLDINRDLRKGEIAPAQILRTFREGLLGQSYAIPTINKHHRTLKTVLRAAECAGVISKMPKISMMREPRRKAHVASFEQIDRIIKACRCARWPREVEGNPVNPVEYWQALVVFLFNVGLRHSDFTDVKITDVDWRTGSVSTLIQKTGDYETKPFDYGGIVLEHLERIRGERIYLFGKKGSRKQRYEWWEKIQRYAELPDPLFTFHDLRRTCGSELYAISPAAAQEMLGHEDVQTTHDSYVNMTEHLREVNGRRPQPQSFGGIKLSSLKIG